MSRLVQAYRSSGYRRDHRQVDILTRYFQPLETALKQPKGVVRGIYLHGGVGTGKSLLMNLFTKHSSCHISRFHFHEFMLSIHARIRNIKTESITENALVSEREALQTLAKQVADTSPILCLDEFQVTDIADAMIMKSLFTTLFQKGIILIATSNTAPQVKSHFLRLMELRSSSKKIIIIVVL